MKNINELPTPKKLHKLFYYDSLMGMLCWKKTGKGHNANQRAGYINPKGYRIVMINKKNYRASRLIWKIHTGEDPGDNQLDHINLIKEDDRICNLRLADNSKNQANVRLRKDNKTGYRGVSYIKHIEKWEARLKNKILGYYNTPQEAAQTYDKEGFRLYGNYFRPNLDAERKGDNA